MQKDKMAQECFGSSSNLADKTFPPPAMATNMNFNQC